MIYAFYYVYCVFHLVIVNISMFLIYLFQRLSWTHMAVKPPDFEFYHAMRGLPCYAWI